MNHIYKYMKLIIKKFLSKKTIIKCEPLLRKFFYMFYIGNNYKCLICNKKLKSFISHNNNKICPNCGSSNRDRRLYSIITEKKLLNKISILDFSPSRSYYHKFKQNALIIYKTTDLSDNFIADYKFDITNIDCKNNSFDGIICYHILEHVMDDMSAISELYRILKNNGFCLIQTPFKEGKIYEDDNIIEPKDRLKHFGQKDHVRIYSLQGLRNRLISKGFKVEIITFNEKKNNYYGFSEFENILICKK